VLSLLQKAGAKATFFLSGVRVAAYTELVADIIGAGHAVYGHAWEHVNLGLFPPSHALEAMRRVEDLLARLRPTPSPYLIRLPYNAGYKTAAMHRAMGRFHPDVHFAYHTLSTEDYLLAEGCGEDHGMLKARCQAKAGELCAHPSLPGSIILMHENPFDCRGELVPVIAETLLPPLLEGITARGLQCGLIRTTAPHRQLDRFLLLKVMGRR